MLEKVDIKTRTLNFQINHEKCINETLKSLKSAGSLCDKHYKKIRGVEYKKLVFYMAFVKFTKQLIFAHLLDLCCL